MSTRRSVVKWFDAKKGYGFIVHPEGGSDIFVHYSAIETDRRFKTLRTGQVVDFELTDGPKGLHAVDVVSADKEDQLLLDGDLSSSHQDSPQTERREQAYGNDSSSGQVSASA
jgi:CspA family cold shock protein